jgi:bifunctional non-homologous end joining protein LigD
MSTRRTRRYGAHAFDTSNAGKLLFPDAGITKADPIDYYERVAEVMLTHVRGRIVTMERYPDGIDGKRFIQKDVPDYFPGWIETVTVEKKGGGSLRQVVAGNTGTLAYLAAQACVTVHVWPSRADRPRHPDRIIFDLDPSRDDFALVVQAWACSCGSTAWPGSGSSPLAGRDGAPLRRGGSDRPSPAGEGRSRGSPHPG